MASGSSKITRPGSECRPPARRASPALGSKRRRSEPAARSVLKSALARALSCRGSAPPATISARRDVDEDDLAVGVAVAVALLVGPLEAG